MMKEGPGLKNIEPEMTTALTEEIKVITMIIWIVITEMMTSLKDKTTIDTGITEENPPL